MMELSRKVFLFKLFKTASLIMVWASLGLFSEITGVTLQDLKTRTASNYEVIGQAVSMRMAGYGAGAVFGGWLFDRLTRFADLIICISLSVAAFICVAIAYTSHIEALYVEFGIQGVMEATIAIAGQQSVIDLWQEKAPAPMHILHLGYGAGSFLVPQIAKPFLSKRIAKEVSPFYLQNCVLNASVANTSQVFINNASMINMSGNHNPNGDLDSGQFELSYIIVMAIILCVAILFLCFFCCTYLSVEGFARALESKPKSLRKIFNFNSCSPGHPYYAAILFVFIAIWFYIAVGGQMIFANYLYSYSRDKLCLTVGKAANIQSTFWVGFTAGRFAGFLSSLFIPMKFLIFIEAIGNMISALILYFFSANAMILWVFSCLSGFFVGPLYPSGIAWANQYLTMTGLAYTFTLIGGSLAGVSFTVAIGYHFEHNGPKAMWYFVLGYSAIACLLTVCMHLIARTRGDKFARAYDENKSDQVEKTNETSDL